MTWATSSTETAIQPLATSSGAAVTPTALWRDEPLWEGRHVALVEPTGMRAMGTAAATRGYLWVPIAAPRPVHRGRLALHIEECIETALVQRGAPPPGVGASTNLDASLSDQLYRARFVEMSGIAVGLPSLQGIVNLGGVLDAEDSAVLRWWMATTFERPVRVVMSSENLSFRLYPSPVPFEQILKEIPQAPTPRPPSAETAQSVAAMELSELPPPVMAGDEDTDRLEAASASLFEGDLALPDLDRALGLTPELDAAGVDEHAAGFDEDAGRGFTLVDAPVAPCEDAERRDADGVAVEASRLEHEAVAHEAAVHEAAVHEAAVHEAAAHEAAAHEAAAHEAAAHEPAGQTSESGAGEPPVSGDVGGTAELEARAAEHTGAAGAESALVDPAPAVEAFGPELDVVAVDGAAPVDGGPVDGEPVVGEPVDVRAAEALREDSTDIDAAAQATARGPELTVEATLEPVATHLLASEREPGVSEAVRGVSVPHAGPRVAQLDRSLFQRSKAKTPFVVLADDGDAEPAQSAAPERDVAVEPSVVRPEGLGPEGLGVSEAGGPAEAPQPVAAHTVSAEAAVAPAQPRPEQKPISFAPGSEAHLNAAVRTHQDSGRRAARAELAPAAPSTALGAPLEVEGTHRPSAPAPASVQPPAPESAATQSAAQDPTDEDPFDAFAHENWQRWVRELSAARGPRPLAAIERLFVSAYMRLDAAVQRGIGDASAREALDEWASNFGKSYVEAYDALRVRGKRPTMVLDVPELAQRVGRLHGARRVQLLLVDGMRFDLGMMVQDRLRESGAATLAERMLLWSALPTNTTHQIELIGKGADGLKDPSVPEEAPAVVARGRAAHALRRIRTGRRELFKLDIIEAALRDGEGPVRARLPQIADDVGAALTDYMLKQQPRTLVMVFGDHGFRIDDAAEGTADAVRQGGAFPEEVLVPAFAWLTGATH